MPKGCEGVLILDEREEIMLYKLSDKSLHHIEAYKLEPDSIYRLELKFT